MQRVVEAIAVVLLLVVGGVGGYLLWSRTGKTPDPLEQAKRQSQQVPVPKSATTAPKLHRTGDPLVLRKNTASATSAAASQPLPQGVQARHIHMAPDKFAISPDGHWGLAIESSKSGMRGAVWDLDEGKLQRFLSAELGKGTTPYTGRDDANFGANTQLFSPTLMAFSPSGQRFAALLNDFNEQKVATIYVWDVASGKLLCRYEEATSLGFQFAFPSDDTVIFQASHALVRLNVDTLEADLLHPYVFNDSVTWCGTHGDLLFIATHQGLATVSLTTKEYRRFPQPPRKAASPVKLSVDNEDPAALLEAMQRAMNPEQQRNATPYYSEAAFSADGTQVVVWRGGRRANIWKIETGEGHERVLNDEKVAGRTVFGKATAGLIAVKDKDESIKFVDVTTDKVVTTLRVPFNIVTLQGMSASATRLVILTHQQSSVVVDFPQGLPYGTFDLADAIGDRELPSTR